ncbi:MAG: M28 family peptidase [Saprospiraceae bacterium]
MKKKLHLLLCALLTISSLAAQTNILLTNPLAESILLGDYNPADYVPDVVIDQPETIVTDLVNELSPENFKNCLIEMSVFDNRNTGSDTTSTTTGIGAARVWAHQKFNAFNADNGDRLIVSYLQFDQAICEMNRHKNILAVLPGVGPQHEEIILVEAHFDSRCKDLCDGDCQAHGMEDNGSGSALVLELSRVMSRYTFNRTIVFMLTIGEEQGLFGAAAFAEYCENKGVQIHAVLNNDIVGGIACGETASPPGCPGLNDIDSINVRLYSFSSFNSPHKSLARFVKLEYQENLRAQLSVKPIINIMSGEDRTGRGGDHIPFRQKGYAAVRFTSANEHGDAGVSDPEYHDRQHTEDDILGIDTDGDQILDSFFVDFNYLYRNALLNGNAAAMAAIGPITPNLVSAAPLGPGLKIVFDDPNDYGIYRVGVRSVSNDFDSVYTITQTEATITGLSLGQPYFVSVATVDDQGIESLFSNELVSFSSVSTGKSIADRKIELLQNRPNPFDDQTSIGVWVEQPFSFQSAEIRVSDSKGAALYRTPITLKQGMNEIWYNHDHHRHQNGILYYSLYIDGKLFGTKSMIYAY